jgi:RNA polymerase sigma-70 factor (ECF subfamily)
MNNIISLFRRGGEGSFEALLAPHMDALFRQAWHYTGSEMEAEDLLQDLLVDLFNRQEKLRAIETLRPWLSRCLYNRFVDQYRKRQRRPELLDSERADYTAAEDPGPENEYWHSEVLQGLEKLNSRQRAVISLHDIQGHTLPELSEILELPLGTLKSQLHRARAKLKDHLKLEPSAAQQRVRD